MVASCDLRSFWKWVSDFSKETRYSSVCLRLRFRVILEIDIRFFQRNYQAALLVERSCQESNEKVSHLPDDSLPVGIATVSYMNSFDWKSILESLHH